MVHWWYVTSKSLANNNCVRWFFRVKMTTFQLFSVWSKSTELCKFLIKIEKKFKKRNVWVLHELFSWKVLFLTQNTQSPSWLHNHSVMYHVTRKTHVTSFVNLPDSALFWDVMVCGKIELSSSPSVSSSLLVFSSSFVSSAVQSSLSFHRWNYQHRSCGRLITQTFPQVRQKIEVFYLVWQLHFVHFDF